MVFPIALGSKSASVRPLSSHAPENEHLDDDSLVPYRHDGSDPLVAVAEDRKCQAIVTVSYLCADDGGEDNASTNQYPAMAQISVQISSLTGPLELPSITCRETVHQIPLASDSKRQTEERHSVKCSAKFCRRRKFLICLIPPSKTDDSTLATLVLFQLRKPRAVAAQPDLPLPPYMQKLSEDAISTSLRGGSSANSEILLVATNPHVLVAGNDMVAGVLDPTCMAILPGLLLIGNQSGQIVATGFRPFVAQEVISFQPPGGTTASIQSLDFSTRNGHDHEQFSGLLAIQWHSGHVSVRSVHRSLKSDSMEGDKSLSSLDHSASAYEKHSTAENTELIFAKDSWEIDPVVHCCLLSETYLSCIRFDEGASAATVSVLCLQRSGATNEISTLSLDQETLEENSHTTFRMESNCEFVAGDGVVPPVCGIDHDAVSDCLTIWGSLRIKADCVLPFVSAWNWRPNILGLTMLGKESCRNREVSDSFVWKFVIAFDAERGRSFILILGDSGSQGVSSLRKETIPVALLSPPESRCFEEDTKISQLANTGTLLLSSSSVSFPVVHASNLSSDDFEVVWNESRIPPAYTLHHGKPSIGSIGTKWGRSIAVCSRRGVCVLDLAVRSKASSREGDARKNITQLAHWRMFGNQSEESSFSVEALQWWEGSKSSSRNMLADDILIAVIEVKSGKSYSRYLACWSIRMLDMRHQLLKSPPNGYDLGRYQWGLRLPDRMAGSAQRIQVLDAPSDDPSKRKAVVLVFNQSTNTDFCVFRLESTMDDSISKAASYVERCPFALVVDLAAAGSVGPCHSVFLASASFDFERNSNSYVATLAVVRGECSGVEAIVVNKDDVEEKGSVVSAARAQTMAAETEIANYYLVDVIQGQMCVEFVWIFQLLTGRLVIWNVPCIAAANSPVPPSFLGHTKPMGTVSMWMQQLSLGTQNIVTMGCIPGSSNGARLCTSQSCRKLHRSLSQEFEHELFSDDFLEHEIFCVGHLSLSTPVYLCSWYGRLLDIATAIEANRGASAIGEYITRKLASTQFTDSVGMAVELLILRCVEQIAKAKTAGSKRSKHGVVLAILADGIFDCFTAGQSARILLEASRKIEPAYVSILFPLNSLSAQGFREDQPCTVTKLFGTFLGHGSVELTVASLPLLPITITASHDNISALLFKYCIGVVEQNLKCGDFSSTPESCALADTFRYGTKVIQQDQPDSEDDEEVAPRSGYSIFCGTLGGRRRKTKAAAYKTSFTKPGVARIMATFLSSLLIDRSGRQRWLDAVSVCSLVRGDGVTGLPCCSKSEFGRKVARLSLPMFSCFLKGGDEKSSNKSLTGVFSLLTMEWEESVSADDADHVLQVLLVVLAISDHHASSIVLLAVVAAHTAGKIDSLLDDDYSDHFVWIAYLKSQTGEF